MRAGSGRQGDKLVCCIVIDLLAFKRECSWAWAWAWAWGWAVGMAVLSFIIFLMRKAGLHSIHLHAARSAARSPVCSGHMSHSSFRTWRASSSNVTSKTSRSPLAIVFRQYRKSLVRLTHPVRAPIH